MIVKTVVECIYPGHLSHDGRVTTDRRNLVICGREAEIIALLDSN